MQCSFSSHVGVKYGTLKTCSAFNFIILTSRRFFLSFYIFFILSLPFKRLSLPPPSFRTTVLDIDSLTPLASLPLYLYTFIPCVSSYPLVISHNPTFLPPPTSPAVSPLTPSSPTPRCCEWPYNYCVQRVTCIDKLSSSSWREKIQSTPVSIWHLEASVCNLGCLQESRITGGLQSRGWGKRKEKKKKA